MEYDFLIRPDELTLSYEPRPGRRRLRFAADDPIRWRERATATLTDLLGVDPDRVATGVEALRETVDADVVVTALRMRVDEHLSIPGYLLRPVESRPPQRVVMVLHGHGEVETSLNVVGVHEDYHHNVAHRLARSGHTVLVPELRGFGALHNVSAHRPGAGLTYWQWGRHMAYTLVTDTFQRGRTLIGDIVEDLLRWENWLRTSLAVEAIDVVGISFGGDLALTYPVFSTAVRSIFASGTLGSFEAVFAISGNAPAHCIPGVLEWFDRADIAGLNAPRPIALHYGALDIPGPDNGSAAYNDTVAGAVAELREMYAAAGAADAVTLLVSPDLAHEFDVPLLVDWLT